MPQHIIAYWMLQNFEVILKKNKTTNAKSMPETKKSVAIYGYFMTMHK